MYLDTPILFLIFNRPDTTQKVFNEIRKAKPRKFFISADGPRESIADDKEKCERTREIIRQIDWDCDVRTLFREKNLGCKVASSSAVKWFFENVEQGIILEDDCLPHPTFFRFCAELLDYYKDDKRIMSIGGSNFQLGRKPTEYSYYFSKYTIMWGWATWKRAWNYYDVNMKAWPEVRDKNLLFNILDNKREASYWKSIFEKVYKNKLETWCFPFLFACWLQNGLVALPAVNLISNIGFGNVGTHTRNKSILANLKSEPVTFPLLHPPYVFKDVIADKFIKKHGFNPSRVYKKIIDLLYGRYERGL